MLAKGRGVKVEVAKWEFGAGDKNPVGVLRHGTSVATSQACYVGAT